jgi:L-iditol 2-dehydrogenase
VLECTGVENSIVTAAYTARRGGTVMVIGVGREIMNNLPFMHLSLGEVISPATNVVSKRMMVDSCTD